MSPTRATDRAELVEVCHQAANLYDALALDSKTRGTARKLRAAAAELEGGAPAPPPAAAPSNDLLMVVSALIGLADRTATGWAVDDETMARLKRAHEPYRQAGLRKSREKETASAG